MTSITQLRPGVKPAAETIRQLEAHGYRPGFPVHLTLAAQRIDRQFCRFARCPACRRRGLEARPFHRLGSYRLMAECPHYHSAEEF